MLEGFDSIEDLRRSMDPPEPKAPERKSQPFRHEIRLGCGHKIITTYAEMVSAIDAGRPLCERCKKDAYPK